MSERMAEGGTWGRYRLGERIGVGGMAEVFKAIAPGAAGFEKTCVIKRILPEYAGDKNFVSMFVNEARIGASLAHPNIVQIYDFGEIEDEYFMSMEYIHGTDLARFLWRLLQRKRTVPGPLVAYIAVDVLRALEFAHNRTAPDGKASPVIHRDVSPQNILVSMDGLVKLADFGLARALDASRLTRPGTLKGKLSYMSPEQAFGKEMDHRTDLFSLGIVMYELLIGKSLFRAKTDAETLARVRAAAVPEFEKVADVHPTLAAAMRKALSREQEKRFASAAEFRRALVDYLRTVTPPVEAATLGSLVREMVTATQKPPESTAEATEMADLEALKIAEAPTSMLPIQSVQKRAEDSDPPDGPWVEGPGAEAIAPAKPSSAAQMAATMPHKTPAPQARAIPPVESPASTRGSVRVEQVVVVGRGSVLPPAPTPPPAAVKKTGGVQPQPQPQAKVDVADAATLIALPAGQEIPVTPAHGVAALQDRATQIFDGTPAPLRDSDEPGPVGERDSEEKVTVMRPGLQLPVGIVPEKTPTPAPAARKASRQAPPADPPGKAPLFTMSAQDAGLPVPSEERRRGTEKVVVSVPPSPPMHGPGIIGLVLIGLGLLVVSAVVTWAIVSF